jgi:anaerobic ribonucleoside-triphosphate reductase
MEPDVKAGKIKNDLHDIEYDIFRGIKKKYRDVHERHGLPAFHGLVDQVAAEAGLKGEQTPDLKKEITKLHQEAAIHLQKLVDEFGIEWIRQFYH